MPQVTLFAKGATMRASKSTHDMYASIDEVSDLVRSKLVKYKEVKLHSGPSVAGYCSGNTSLPSIFIRTSISMSKFWFGWI
jgi:hypothetical protein